MRESTIINDVLNENRQTPLGRDELIGVRLKPSGVGFGLGR